VPITLPNLDNRRYPDLLNEALARIPVYTPEWTNFNKSDPGVTLIEVFAFLTENLLYRCNQIPDRNRLKFLSLLNIPLQPATAAQGLVTISNDKAPLQTVTLNDQLEVRAGQVPFRTTRGLDVLPIEGRIYYKQTIPSPSQALLDYYQQLYASFRGSVQSPPAQPYQVSAFPLPGGAPLSIGDAVDGYLWLALLVREGDRPAASYVDQARDQIGGKTLTVGIVPYLPDGTATLPAGRSVGSPSTATLQFDIPNLPPSGGLLDSQNRVPQYRPLASSAANDVFSNPGVVDITLPDKSGLFLWNNIDPLESGVDQLPPAIDDSTIDDRLITWIRIRPSAVTPFQLLWIGINASPVVQREHVTSELLATGTGEPDQTFFLSQAPVLLDSIKVIVTSQGDPLSFSSVTDLYQAGPEIPVPDLRLPPGSPAPTPLPSTVFLPDPESGQITFGDGAHGMRPPDQSIIRADYDFCLGGEGNVGAGAIKTSPVLPEGFTVANPVRTWGGADAETPEDGEKQIARTLQHRDRLVTASDFETITLRTPGLVIGRVEVMPAFHPDLSSGRGGDAPGAVTLMLIPAFDPVTPLAPSPSNDFLNTVCSYLDPRRLVTTEVFLRGPIYVGIWVSIGYQPLPGATAATVREAIKAAITAFLAPTTGGVQQLADDPSVILNAPTAVYKGWPLGKSVIALEIMAVAGRTPGVEFVQPVLLSSDGDPVAQLDFTGIELPQLLGISVTEGDPLGLDELRGSAPASGGTGLTGIVQVPAIPQECSC
jgi:hypothetical protein